MLNIISAITGGIIPLTATAEILVVAGGAGGSGNLYGGGGGQMGSSQGGGSGAGGGGGSCYTGGLANSPVITSHGASNGVITLTYTLPATLQQAIIIA